MQYDPAKHHRRSIRLRDYDYGAPGAYFVTICVQGRECLFGAAVEPGVRLNEAGQMVAGVWQALPERFPNVRLDAYVVMPNHLHGIVIIVEASLVDAPLVDAGAGTSPAPTRMAGQGHLRLANLGNVIGAFKSLTTNSYINGVRQSGWPPFSSRLWQRNYWEHVIVNDRELDAVRVYIQNNPARWALDRDNPDNKELT